MAAPNFADKTIWVGDNLYVLRGMNSECVDLIYLDPPFNSNQDYAAPVGSKAAGAAFKDTWELSEEDDAWLTTIAESWPAVAAVIQTARATRGKGMQSYLTMMAIRLIEMRRVLKSTGSIYLHCDDAAGHYLKLLMDAVFGSNRFYTAITWKRTSAHNDRMFGDESAMILMYGGDKQNPDAVRVGLNEKHLSSKYTYYDDRGRYLTDNLTGPGVSGGESGEPWRSFDPGSSGRCWSVPKTGKYARYLNEVLLPGYLSIEGVHARLDALDEAGMIHYSSRGGMPRLKRYLLPDAGQLPGNIWTDINPVNSQAKENTGYPTQKPIALLERIIQASSNEGDLVFDPFCGCATTCVAADRLGRRWVGIDLSPKTVDLVADRLHEVMGGLFYHGYVTARSDIPRRTDLGKLPPYQSHKPTLYGEQGGNCAGCGTHFLLGPLLEVDHIIPKSKGGTDHKENLQLLCTGCNKMKGDRPQEYLMARLNNQPVWATK